MRGREGPRQQHSLCALQAAAAKTVATCMHFGACKVRELVHARTHATDPAIDSPLSSPSLFPHIPLLPFSHTSLPSPFSHTSLSFPLLPSPLLPPPNHHHHQKKQRIPRHLVLEQPRVDVGARPRQRGQHIPRVHLHAMLRAAQQVAEQGDALAHQPPRGLVAQAAVVQTLHGTVHHRHVLAAQLLDQFRGRGGRGRHSQTCGGGSFLGGWRAWGDVWGRGRWA